MLHSNSIKCSAARLTVYTFCGAIPRHEQHNRKSELREKDDKGRVREFDLSLWSSSLTLDYLLRSFCASVNMANVCIVPKS